MSTFNMVFYAVPAGLINDVITQVTTVGPVTELQYRGTSDSWNFHYELDNTWEYIDTYIAFEADDNLDIKAFQEYINDYINLKTGEQEAIKTCWELVA